MNRNPQAKPLPETPGTRMIAQRGISERLYLDVQTKTGFERQRAIA
jgi:hypothetical protein